MWMGSPLTLHATMACSKTCSHSTALRAVALQRVFPADTPSRFLAGMKLEVSGLVDGSPQDCHIVTVDKLFGLHLIMLIDGCAVDHDALVRIVDSPDMHPLGWAKSVGARVVPHKGQA